MDRVRGLFHAAGVTEEYDRIDDFEEKRPRLPDLPIGYLDSIKTAGEDAYRKDMDIVEGDVAQKPDLSKILYEGPLHRGKRPDTLGWLPEFGSLKGDQFSLYVDAGHVQQTYCCTVTFAYVEDLSFGKPPKKGEQFTRDKIVVFSKGRRIHLAFSDTTAAPAWMAAFHNLMAAKFSDAQLKAKDDIVGKYHLLWLHQLTDVSFLKSQHKAELFAEVGVNMSEKKQYQSYISCRHQATAEGALGKKEKLYAILTNTGISLIRKREEVDPAASRTVDRTLTVIMVKYILKATSKGQVVSICTPLVVYDLKCRTEAIATEWVSSITTCASSIPVDIDSGSKGTYVNKLGYVYTGDIIKNIWFEEKKDGSAKTAKKYKIKKLESTVGRSHSVDIKLDDAFVSRCHFKIVISKNVPFIVDLTGNGIKLNDKKVTEPTPLKPGDCVGVGKSFLYFTTKPKKVVFSIDH